MAYIQDISLMMRELLKVPKDYTPTALEISKYIRSRYTSDQADCVKGRRPMGSRGFSSASRSAPPRVSYEQQRQRSPSIRVQQPHKPLRMVNKHHKMSGRGLSYAAGHLEKTKGSSNRNQAHGTLREEKKSFSTAQLKKSATKSKSPVNEVWNEKPKTAPVEPQDTPTQQTTWNWKTAKSHIRRAMSDLVVTPSRPKNKLGVLSEQMKVDPRTEQALESKRKMKLKEMVDPDLTEREPMRTREIIQRLLEENKLEDQRREIARLTELARSKLMEAQKASGSVVVGRSNRRRRDDRY